MLQKSKSPKSLLGASLSVLLCSACGSIDRSVGPLTQNDYATMAEAVAGTLASPEARDLLLRGMIASSHPRHALYFREAESTWPPGLVRAIKDNMPGNGGRFRDFSASSDSVILVMPVAWDRATWEGTGDVVVFGMHQAAFGTSDTSLASFGIEGPRENEELREDYDFPILMIAPARDIVDSGVTDLTVLGDVNSRSTVSTLDEEFWSPLSDYNRTTPSGNVTPHSLPSGLSFLECTSSEAAWFQDSDNDRVHDPCEREIAERFRPLLFLDPNDAHEPFWEPYWEVRRPLRDEGDLTIRSPRNDDFKNELWVFYALAYYRDTGPFSHPGDSEFIVASVVSAGPHGEDWGLSRMCLSAHWGTPWGKKTSMCGEPPRDPVGRVIVSSGKHANYLSLDLCRRAKGGWEKCDNSNRPTLVEFEASAQIGPPRPLVIHKSRKNQPQDEMLWNEQRFCGWQTVEDRRKCAGSYSRALRVYRFDRSFARAGSDQ